MTGGRFHVLRGGGVSLVIDIHPGGLSLPRIVHFGPDPGEADDPPMHEHARPNVLWGARLDHPRPACILPGAEEGYFGFPAIVTAEPTLFRVEDVDVTAHTLSLRLAATRNGPLSVVAEYRLSADGVLSARSSCRGAAGAVRRLAALALVLPPRLEELVSFGGDWAREFRMQRQLIGNGRFVLESRRGRPGHDRFPGLFLGERGFGNDHGDVVGVTLGWSGNHHMSVEALREGDVMLQAGELHDGFEDLACDYESPWCHVVYSGRGLNGAMQALHAFARADILPDTVSRRPRPVHYNTWEAIYFRHDVPTLIDLVDRAALVGAERFVLDDGWFQGRNDDRTALGDWTVDQQKYPEGLAPLIGHVHARGLEFGLWVEPEMVNPDSDLARAHPEWIRRDAGQQILMRHQCVLDVSRPDVRAHLFNALDRLLSDHAIAYLKWDMNRDLTGVGHHAHVMGVHALIDRLRLAHPRVEIETCASGGGRCDFGMLARAERVWVSDSNDALDRFDIQRHANLFLPPEVSGVHVGPAQCHITGRRLSLDLRAHVAIFGHMGIELDLRELEPDDLHRLAAHVSTYKTFRPLLHSGRWWHVDMPGGDHAGVAVSAADGSEALCLVVRTGSGALGRGTSLRLPGLDPARRYSVAVAGPHAAHVEQCLPPGLRNGKLRISGAGLTRQGLSLFLPRPASSLVLHACAD